MKMIKKGFVLVLIAILAVSLVACGNSSSSEDDKTEPGKNAADPKEATDSGESDDLHPIYKDLPKNALTGVLDPNMPDRADIEKAWPKTPKDPNKITIGWTDITLGNPFFVAVKDGAEQVAEKYGFDLTFLSADSDVSKQSAQIESFVTKGVDVIVVDPTDVLGPVNDINRAVEAGIPVIAIGTVPDASAQILTTISFNPYEVGYQAGEYIGDQYSADEVINSAVIIGVMGNSTSESRVCGMLGGVIASRMKAMGTFTVDEDAMLRGYEMFDEIKKSGKASAEDINFNVLAYGEGQWTQEGGLSVAEDILTAVGEKINLILPDNDHMSAGALKAIEAAGKKGQIKVGTCSDGATFALEMVKNGDLICNGSWSGAQVGAHTVEFIKAIFQDGKDPSNLPLGAFFPSITFTKDNVDEYIVPGSDFYAVPEFVFPKSIPELKSEMGK
jgi:ribose transport system substrate-binding protein